MHEPHLTVRCFPSTDEEFRRTTDTLLGEADKPGDASEGARAALEARLRGTYPQARVRHADPLAGMGLAHVWYAYRDSGDLAEAPRRVLVIEDDPAMARMIAAAMVSEGADVRSAVDGRVALEIARSWEPDVIVLDLGLPELDGAGFAAGYRRRRGRAPIIVVSGAPDASATSARIGARAWLPKPFDLDLLLELVLSPDRGLEVDRP